MDGAQAGTIALAALKATGSVASISAIGVALAWKGKLDKVGLKALGTLTFWLILPSLTFTSVGGGMSIEYWQEFWGLFLFGVAICLVGFLVGRAIVPLSGVSRAFKPWFVLACAFPNIFAIPLVYIEAICRRENEDPSAAESCINEGNQRLFTFIMFFPILLYGFGGSYAMSHAAIEQEKLDCTDPEKIPDEENAGGPKSDAESPSCPTAEIASVEGADTNLKELDAPETSVADEQSATNDVKQISSLPSVSMALDSLINNKDVGSVRWQFRVSVLENPPVISTILAVIVAAAKPLQGLLFGTDAPLQFFTNGLYVIGKACPCVTNIVMAANLGLQMKKMTRWSDIFGGPQMGISRRTLLTLVFAKMVVMPVVIFTVIVNILPFLPADRWYQLLLFMEAATPTANNVVMLATVLGEQDAAQLLALTTIVQFVIFLPISTLCTASGLGMTRHLV